MTSVAHTILVWKHPIKRDRYVLGDLRRDQNGYSFQNKTSGRHSLLDAVRAGYTPLAAFGTGDEPQHSPNLFPVFARRLPPGWRVGEYEKLGLDQTQDIEYLLATGGRMPGDSFEFLRPMPDSDEMVSQSIRLDFPVAGWQYYDGEQAIEHLKPGAPLRLELEADNEYDKSAIKIFAPTGHHLGYVPRIYSWYFDDCIEEQRYQAEVKELGLREDPQLRMVVTFQLSQSDAKLRQVPEGLKKLALV